MRHAEDSYGEPFCAPSGDADAESIIAMTSAEKVQISPLWRPSSLRLSKLLYLRVAEDLERNSKIDEIGLMGHMSSK
jgi:hypothetical protein